MGFPGGTSGKEPACQCRKIRDAGLIPKSGRSPGGEHGNLLQYSCQGNPKDRGVWWATIHRVTKSWIGLKQFSTYAYIYLHIFLGDIFILVNYEPNNIWKQGKDFYEIPFNVIWFLFVFSGEELFSTKNSCQNFSEDKWKGWLTQIGLVFFQEVSQFSCWVMSDSLQPHGLKHSRLPCPSPTPRACSILPTRKYSVTVTPKIYPPWTRKELLHSLCRK